MRACGLLLGLCLALLVGCQAAPAVTPSPTAPSPTLPAATDTPRPTATLTPTATPTVTPTATATPSPTPDPYAAYTIEGLAARAYGAGEVTVVETIETTAAFERLLITYPSDGLTIYGFVNVPIGEGPFPVAMVLHGYIPPEQYQTVAYTTRYADALARAGYLVLHPNLRNFPPSDDGPDLFRVGMAIDVLNLIAMVRRDAGQPGLFERADASRLGLLGHSMGGGIAIRVVTVDPTIRAAVLYGSISADDRTNAMRFGGGERRAVELGTAESDLARISPGAQLERIQAAISIHHSIDDETVPVEWSEDLCARLEELGKDVACYYYRETPHTFRGAADQLFIERYLEFFARALQ